MSTFINRDDALHYDRVVYGRGSHDAWVWELERGYLLELVDRHQPGRPRYLDFACGSGRVLALLEGRAAEATGVDISAEMVALARPKLTASRLMVGDPTADPTLAPGPYDLVTAFRFLLNADDDLRGRALDAIHRALADDGLLVLNLHGNATSLRGLSLAARRLRPRPGPPPRQLSWRRLRRLLDDHGFQAVEVLGYGFLTAGWQRLLGRRAALALERLGRRGPLRFLAVHLLVACRKRPAEPTPDGEGAR
jgi:SAM-dependent methyltransferase